MFNANNNNNGNNSQNIWDQMALFNQYTLRNILNGRNDLGTPELRAAVASMNEEQKDDTLVFLECNMEELAGLPDGRAVSLKTKIALELRDSPEIFQVAEDPSQLAILLPSITGLLCNEPPSFSQKSFEQKLRSTLLEFLNKLPFTEALRGHIKIIAKTLLRVLRIDNEDNALVSFKILIDLIRCFKRDLENEVVELYEALRDIFQNMEHAVRECFDSPGTPSAFGNLALGSPRPTSPVSELNESSSRPLIKSSSSFKLLIESPTLLKPFLSSHKEQLGFLMEIILPAALEFLKLQAAPQLEAHQTELAKGGRFIGISPAIKNRQMFSDFIVAQVKTMVFLMVMYRGNLVNLTPHRGMLFDCAIRLLCECPPDHATVRKDIYYTITYVVSHETRNQFLSHMDILLSEQTMGWDSITTKNTLKYFGLSAVYEAVSFFRADLSFDHLSKAAYIFIRGLHDPLLSFNMQQVCIKLLATLIEPITKSSDRGKSRLLVMHILDAFANKVDSISQTIPFLRKLFSGEESNRTRPFPTIVSLTNDNIDEFDFEKIRPFASLIKSPQNPSELLKEARPIFRTLFSHLDVLMRGLVLTSQHNEHLREVASGLSSEDILVFARLFRDAIKCMHLYIVDRPKETLPQTIRDRDGSSLNLDCVDVRDISRMLVVMLHHTDLAVFHEVVFTHMEFFFDQFLENSQLGILSRMFLASEKLSSHYLIILVNFLIDRLIHLGNRDEVYCSRFLFLFSLVFQTISINPSNEYIILPHLPTVFRKCFDHPAQASECSNYYLLLKVLFAHLSLSTLEKSHAEVVQRLPQVVSDLLLSITSTSKEMREILIELLLDIHLAVTYTITFTHQFMIPIIFALNGSSKLAYKGLMVLDSTLDSTSRDHLTSIIDSFADELIYGISKHIHSETQDNNLSIFALRVLGKLGSTNRSFLLYPPRAGGESTYFEGCDFTAILEFEGRPHVFSMPLRHLISLSYNVLSDVDSDSFYKTQAFQLVTSSLSLVLNLEPLASEDILVLREKALKCLSEASDEALVTGGDLRYILTENSPTIFKSFTSQEDITTVARKQRDCQSDSLKKIINSLFVSATTPELQNDANTLIEGLMSYLALVKVTEVLDSLPSVVADFAQRLCSTLPTGTIIEALVDAITSNDPKLTQIGFKALSSLEKNCLLILGERQCLSRLPLFAQICEQLCACCYQDDWFRKENAYNGIALLVSRLDLNQAWLLRQEPRIVASLIYVLKSTASSSTISSHFEQVWQTLHHVIIKAHSLEDNANETEQREQYDGVMRLIGQVISELFSGNASLRQTIKSILNLCAKSTKMEIQALLTPFAIRLQNLMFNRPMRALPISLMVGAFDAIAFILDARPSFIRGEDQLPTFTAECLALLDSEDESYNKTESRDERVMTRFRVKCIGVIMSALVFFEHVSQPGLLRTRCLRVFFKFLHNDCTEIAEAATQALKVLLAQHVKLPKDLLQEVLKPYLTSISDYTLVTLPHLKGLARMLDILTHYFKIEIGSKLYDSMQRRAQVFLLPEMANTYLPDQVEVSIITAILNIFQFLPPIGSCFLKDLVPSAINMETFLRRNSSSPFRTPLIRFLNKYPGEAVQYFYDHFDDERFVQFFVSLINSENATGLRKEITLHPETLVRIFDETQNNNSDIGFHFICIARACCRYQSDWLSRTPVVLERLISLWRSPGRHSRMENEGELGINRLRESYYLSQLFMLACSQDPANTGIVFEVATIFASSTFVDYTSLRNFFRNLALRSAPSQKRALLIHFLHLIGTPTVSTLHLATFLHHLINPMILTAFVRGNHEAVLDSEVVSLLHNKIWESPEVDSSPTRCTYLRLELIQLTSLLLQYASDIISESRKEIIQFGFGYLKLEDMVCRQAAHLLVARFIAAYSTPDNIIMHVYGALLKANVHETKLISRHALDTIVKVLPNRPIRPGEDSRFPIWIRFTKVSLGEEIYNISHIINIYLLISRHPRTFFDYRKHFIPQMVFMLPKLGLLHSPTDAKSLIVQLCELIYTWEVQRIDGFPSEGGEIGFKRSPSSQPNEESASKKAKSTSGSVLDPQKDFVITPLMREITLSSLIHLFCSCGDLASKKNLGLSTLAVFKNLANLPSWTDTLTPLSLFESSLSVTEAEETHVSATVALEMMFVLITSKPSTWLMTNLKPFKEYLVPIISVNSYVISTSLHPLLKHVFTVVPSQGSPNYSPELSQLQVAIEEAVQKGLSDPLTMGSSLLLLDAVSTILPELVDNFIPTVARLFQRLAKDHVAPNISEKVASFPVHLSGWRNLYPANIAPNTSITSLDSPTNAIIRALDILKSRISYLGDHRKTLLSALGLLLEKSHDKVLLRHLFGLVSDWVQHPTESFPTAKEKANLLLSMIDIELRGDTSLVGDYLGLVLAIYEDPSLARSELTVKLESAFMLGTRIEFPATRARFLNMLDCNIPRPLPLRLKYILGIHDWEPLSSHFWIPQATYLLLGSTRYDAPLQLNKSNIKLPCPSKVFIPKLNNTAEKRPVDENAIAFATQLDIFVEEISDRPSEDLIIASQILSSLDPSFQVELWATLFAQAWSALLESERNDIIKLIITLLAKNYHQKQAALRPNAVQALLAGLEKCRPFALLPPHLVKFLGVTFNAWHISIPLLENSLVAIDSNPEKDEVLIKSSVEDALGELLEQLGEHEMLYGLWSRRCKYPITSVAITYAQHNYWDLAQASLEQAQNLANKNALSSCESEYCLWEDQWVLCAEKLQQWDILEELGDSINNQELKIRASWHKLDLNSDLAPFHSLVTQVNTQEFRTSFNHQIQSYRALSSLCQAPNSFSESIDIFRSQEKIALQELSSQWHTLPHHISAIHLPLLSTCQQLVEAEVFAGLFHNLTEIDRSDIDLIISQVEHTLTSLRKSVPRFNASLEVWSDIASWRQHIYGSLAKALHVLFLPTEASGMQKNNSSLVNLLQKSYHEQAWILSSFAKAARKQHQYSTCMNILARLHSLPNVHVSDAFTKLIEHSKCYFKLPGQAEKGLSIVDKSILKYFSTSQKVEHFVMKSQFLLKLGKTEEANQALSNATQLDTGVAKSWAVWGRFNESTFLESKDIEYGTFALNCYMQAAVLYKNPKSRKYIAKIIYLFNLDDEMGTLLSSFDRHKSDMQLWYWIFFIPQILTGMTQKSSALMSNILFQIAKHYPQALYFNLLTAREEYAVLRNIISINDGEESEYDVYKQAWDYLSEITDSIKIHVPMFSMTAMIFTDALSKYPKPSVAEEMYQLTNTIASEAITLLCNRLSNQPFELLSPYNFPKFSYYTKILPSGPVREAFDSSFVNNPPNLIEFVGRIRRWRDHFEKLLSQQPQKVLLDSFSPSMLNAESPSLSDIPIPGQYIEPKEETEELVKVTRFLPQVEVLIRHNVAHYKLSMQGNNGQVYSFLLQNSATHVSRREERFAQLAHCINSILRDNEEATQRQLQFHVPHLIPMGHSLRMIQYKETYASLHEMYDEHCLKTGIARDKPFVHSFKRLKEVQGRTPSEMLNIRMEIMNEVSACLVPPSLVTSFLMRCIPNHTEWWLIRKHLISQLALVTFLTYSMGMGCRLPSLLLFSLQTGELWLQEAVPTLNRETPTFQSNEPVPFRLTPCIQHLITKRGLGGFFTACILTTARSMTEPVSSLSDFLPLFMREEYLFWVTFNKTVLDKELVPDSPSTNSNLAPRVPHSPKLNPKVDPLQNSHDSIQRLVNAVSKKVDILACQSKNQNSPSKTPINLPITELISYATNPVKLAQMDYSWMPWL